MSRNKPKHNVSQQSSKFLRNGLKALPSRNTSQVYSAYQETIATGGTVFYGKSTSTGIFYKYHYFTSGTSEFKILNAGTYGRNFDIFLVAGGGGGGGAVNPNESGGGGGSGDAKVFENHPLAIGSYSVQVGTGGTGGLAQNGNDGGDSSFNKTLTCSGGKAGKANGAGGNSGNGFIGGQTVTGIYGGGGGASTVQNGYNAGIAYIEPFSGELYSDTYAGGLGGGGKDQSEFSDFLTFETKLSTNAPSYLSYPLCFGGGGAGLYSEVYSASRFSGVGIVDGYFGSKGAGVAYDNQAQSTDSFGSGGGGGGFSNYPSNGWGANGSAGVVVIRYPLNPSFRVPVTITINPFVALFEEGISVSRTFSAYAYPETITHTVTSGALPTGISLSSAGVLSGTPTVPNQNYSFTVTSTNGFTSVSTVKSGTVAPFAVGAVLGAYSDTTSGGYRTIVWRGAGSMNIASGARNMEVLAVGGGGSGGMDCGGGGGGGAMFYSASIPVVKGTKTVVVGAGGAKSSVGGVDGASGGYTQFGDVASYCNGGGRGGRWGNAYGVYPGGGGGSWGGGGSSGRSGSNFFSQKGGNAAPYYAVANEGYYFGMGGGGGATTAGGNGLTYLESNSQTPSPVSTGGNGGTGKTVFGTTYADGGGGGGSASYYRPQSLGGSGNGGKGQSNPGAKSLDAVPYTGSGGGGSTNSGVITMYAGNGSAGVVIVRYLV